MYVVREVPAEIALVLPFRVRRSGNVLMRTAELSIRESAVSSPPSLLCMSGTELRRLPYCTGIRLCKVHVIDAVHEERTEKSEEMRQR